MVRNDYRSMFACGESMDGLIAGIKDTVEHDSLCGEAKPLLIRIRSQNYEMTFVP